MTSHAITRRGFGALVAGAAVAAPQTPPRRPLAPDTPPFEGGLSFSFRRAPQRVEPFPMRQVRLLPGSIYSDARDWNRGYMSRLAADRLLYTFRANAGLPTGAAKPLGGWEQPE